MPSIVACPSCGGKLRVADELRGRSVRCPACGHTFDTDPANDPPPDLPLQLALDEPSQPRPAPAGGTPGLIGAVELKRSRDDEASSPSEPPRSGPPKRTLPPRLSDDADEDLPSFRHRGRRRDAEPDRGPLVLTLGILSLACLTLSCVPIGLILGLFSWIMGQADLRKMKRGDMDVNGQGITQAGWICGILGTLLNGLLTLGCLGFIGLFWYDREQPSAQYAAHDPAGAAGPAMAAAPAETAAPGPIARAGGRRMMTRNHRQEALCRAYVQAVAALAGATSSKPEPDYGIDLSLREIAVRDRRYHDTSVQIDLQLRGTTRANRTDTTLNYDLDMDTYNDLRIVSAGCPRLLVVLVLPKEEEHWLSQSPNELSIRHCAYWLSLEGAPPLAARRSIRVTIPLANRFTSETVRTLLRQARKRRRS